MFSADYLVALQIQRQELGAAGVGAEAPARVNAPGSPDYAAMVARSEQAREYQQPVHSAQQHPSQSYSDDVLINPETGQPYSDQEIAWMRQQEQQFRRQAHAQSSTTRTRRKSDSGDCLIL